MNDLGIADRLRELRLARGFSLSELARRADIGKATLSEIESGRRNPNIETLYALCEPLDVPLTGMLGETPGAHGTAAGGMVTVLLSTRHLDGATIEVFRLEFPAGARHVSPSHGEGVREQLSVVSGTLIVGVADRPATVHAGECHAWTSDREHVFAAPDGSAEAVVVITTHSTTCDR
ncbi:MULTISPECIES: helix-turn-helix domain-containing protein [Gordonia]|uniref:Helix-turn-helix domain-containing protein n=1 Tax=Gordonia cholesterolivorans TaxID=559625 RepID=A0ABN3H900_9ACTN|nr:MULTISPECIES: XRE family transcriptional regulator [Gordonia]KJR09793.1 XRE family transcriptional regulator [Gordonia sihwensis]KXT56630.1 XRE family transcriptional regulator [Gordonia sp. QH-12]